MLRKSARIEMDEPAVIADCLRQFGEPEGRDDHFFLRELMEGFLLEAQREAESLAERLIIPLVCYRMALFEVSRGRDRVILEAWQGEVLRALGMTAVYPLTTTIEVSEPTPTVHACSPKGSGLMPCCGATPFERTGDRLTVDPAQVTCKGGRPDA